MGSIEFRNNQRTVRERNKCPARWRFWRWSSHGAGRGRQVLGSLIPTTERRAVSERESTLSLGWRGGMLPSDRVGKCVARDERFSGEENEDEANWLGNGGVAG